MWFAVAAAWAAFLSGMVVGIMWGRNMRGTEESEKLDYAYLDGIYSGQRSMRDDIRTIILADSEQRDAFLRIPTVEEMETPGVAFFAKDRDNG